MQTGKISIEMWLNDLIDFVRENKLGLAKGMSRPFPSITSTLVARVITRYFYDCFEYKLGWVGDLPCVQTDAQELWKMAFSSWEAPVYSRNAVGDNM